MIKKIKKRVLLSSLVISLFLFTAGCAPKLSVQRDPSLEQRINQSFAVYGDSRNDHTKHRKIVNDILTHDVDFVLHTGDMVSKGTAMDEWDAYFEITNPLKGKIYPTPGNHEFPFDNYFKFYAHLYEQGKTYYSFDRGNAHFISLDSTTNLAKDSPQYNWLIKDLENNNADWTVAYLHHPVYSSGEHGSSQKLIDNLAPVFEKYKVDMVFSGHDHIYERTHPIKEGKVDKEGVVYIITGGGGASLYNVKKGWWTAKSQKVNNYVIVGLGDNILILRAYNIENKKIDEYNITK